MRLPPQGRIEWNLNTLVAGAGFLGTIVMLGVTWGTLRSNVEAMDAKFVREIARVDERTEAHRAENEKRWRDHEQYHKERLADVSAKTAADAERFRTIENDSRKIDNLTYRMTVQEQGAATLAKSVEELKVTVNSQASDIRVMREILQRMDPRAQEGRNAASR